MITLKRAFQQLWEDNLTEAEEKKIPPMVVVPNTFITPVGPQRSPPMPIGGRSPVIGRSTKDNIIPFQLPPTIGSLQVKSESDNISPTWFPRSPTLSRVGGLYQSCDRLSVDSWSQKSPRGSPNGSSSQLNSPQHSPSRSPDQRTFFVGKIQPELYKYTENQDVDLPISRCGRLWFSVVYDAAVESLTVKVIKVKQLPLRTTSNNPPDSFVKLFILPDERISQQTKVKLRNCNPAFNETFVFQDMIIMFVPENGNTRGVITWKIARLNRAHRLIIGLIAVSEEDLGKRSLRMSVYDLDKKKSTRRLLGHSLVGLGDVDPMKANEVLWRDLDDIAHPGDSGTSLGELKISLTYLPGMSRLNVVVLGARSLRKMDLDETGIYVKVLLSQGHRIVKTRRTSIEDGAADPQYNESFSFKVTAKDMENTCLLLNVVTTGGRGAVHKMTSTLKNNVTRGRYGSEHKYGQVSVGSFMYCRGEHLLHWQEMLAHPSKTIARWHALSEVVNNH